MYSFDRIRVETEFGETNYIYLNEIFDNPNYYFRKSITIPVIKEWFEFFKNNGWYSLKTEKAHFKSKS